MSGDMADYALSMDPLDHDSIYPERRTQVCRVCGQSGLVWGRPAKRWRLFNESDGSLHDCPRRPLPKNESQLERTARRQPSELADLAEQAAAVHLFFNRWKQRLALDKTDFLERLADATQAVELASHLQATFNTRTRVLTLVYDQRPFDLGF